MVESKARVQPAFRWRSRVYWEDTDAGGVVYHARYLMFLERARTEWLRALGVGQQALRASHGVVFLVRKLCISYDRPARLDDELDATVCVERVRAASMELTQSVLRVAGSVTLARAQIRVACVGAQDGAPRRMPPHVAASINRTST
jgi:acyl-CoA thioester hydrolase